GALALLDARGLAGQIAQVIQPRLVHAAARDHFDLVDVRRVIREDPLDADAVRDLADGERPPRPLRHPADPHAFERLQARLLTLADLRPHLDGVAGAELGELGFAALALV